MSKYFGRRLTRLEPPYLIVMLGFFLIKFIPLLPLDSNLSRGTLVSSLLASLAYSHFFVFRESSFINGVAWSLEVEVQFYLLAPLLAFLIFTRNRTTRSVIYLGIFLLCPIMQYILESHYGISIEKSRKTIVGNFQFFAMGFFLAEMYLYKRFVKLPTSISVLWGLALLSGLFLVPIRHAPWENRAVFLACIVLFYWLVLSPGIWQRLFRFAPIAAIGGMCYSIYLLHFPLLRILGNAFKDVSISVYFMPNYFLHFFIVMVPILLTSSIFFLLVEKPCMNPSWPSNLWQVIKGRACKANFPSGEFGNSEYTDV